MKKMSGMQRWNQRRLNDFFKLNFKPDFCRREIDGESMTVTDEQGDSITFEIRDNRIYCPELNRFFS